MMRTEEPIYVFLDSANMLHLSMSVGVNIGRLAFELLSTVLLVAA
jgi:hypothetical protein